ncbi:MAG: hypothetical protein AAF449_24760, partial [Myxococcota bacterium]
DVLYRLVVTRDPGMFCPDDSREPNDSLAQAAPLAGNAPYEGRLCPADPDWFILRGVAAGSRIDIELDVTHALGDLDLEVYRAGSDRPLLTSASRTNNEQLSFDASFGGDFFVRVVGKGADTNVYRLRATVSAGIGTACLDDPAEPNNGPLAASSTAALSSTDGGGTLCGGDDDWYAVELKAFETMVVDLSHDIGADLELKLYEPGTVDPNVTPLQASTGVLTRESFSFRTFEDSVFPLRVQGVSDRDISPYRLNVDVVPAFFDCTDDRFDEADTGDTRDSAANTALPPFATRGLSVCANDEDWYRILLRGGQRNVVRMSFPVDLAQLEFEIYRTDSATPLISTEGEPRADARESVLNVVGEGFVAVFIRVFSPSGAEAPYALSVDAVPFFACLPDASEPNNQRPLAASTASSTAGATLADLTLCPSVRSLPDPLTGQTFGDEDWFILRPPRIGARIDARIDFAQGDLLLELFSPNGGPRNIPSPTYRTVKTPDTYSSRDGIYNTTYSPKKCYK